MILVDSNREDAERAKDILLRYSSLSARDSLHIAIMQRHGIERIMSFDGGLDAHPDLQRLH